MYPSCQGKVGTYPFERSSEKRIQKDKETRRAPARVDSTGSAPSAPIMIFTNITRPLETRREPGGGSCRRQRDGRIRGRKSKTAARNRMAAYNNCTEYVL